MSSVRPLVLGVIADLRSRGLLPVAILLAAALVAVPMLLSSSPEPAPVEAVAPVDPIDTGGLPGPAEALGERSLVTLASLERSSELDSFSARDPFEPLRPLRDIVADQAVATSVAQAGAASAAGGSSGTQEGSGGDAGSGGAVGGEPSTGGDTGEDTEGQTPVPEPTPPPAPERRFTYAVDVIFDGPDAEPRTYRNLPRLSMLPSLASPLLIFLGVGADENEVVFLVDAKLRPSPEGEGSCSPSPEDCATIALEPGEQQVFLDDTDRRYLLQAEQIREVLVADAARALARRTTGSATGLAAPAQRFLPQLLTELLVIGGRP